ncbi:hypothetical protein FO519_004894 [Halicephalobus sp. NKZ332]|nr:hypothetical protein FO519_004894 [Halicephalobus sp. NKZ332]
MSKLVFIFALVFLSSVDSFNQQSVGARGRLMCGSTPAANTNVKLWNKNTLRPDDQLASVQTDSQGNFQISGGEGSIFSMDVHLKIYTSCGRWLPCDRKLDFTIPSQYVTRTSSVQNWFDLGTINLELKTKNEDTSCINRRKRFIEMV